MPDVALSHQLFGFFNLFFSSKLCHKQHERDWCPRRFLLWVHFGSLTQILHGFSCCLSLIQVLFLSTPIDVMKPGMVRCSFELYPSMELFIIYSKLAPKKIQAFAHVSAATSVPRQPRGQQQPKQNQKLQQRFGSQISITAGPSSGAGLATNSIFFCFLFVKDH